MIVKRCRDKIKDLSQKLSLVKGNVLNPRKEKWETTYNKTYLTEKIDYLTQFYKKGTYVIGFMYNKEDQTFNVCYRTTKDNHVYLGWVSSNKDINNHLKTLEEILTGE